MIALICAVQTETELILQQLAGTRRTSTIGSKSINEGTLFGRRVCLCVGGMGKVNAAHAATVLISRFELEAVIIFGIGGAYPSSGAGIGDLAIATEEIAGDEGVLTREGFKDTGYIGIPLLKTATSMVYTTFPASQPLVHRSHESLIAHRRSGQGTIHIGSFVTLSTCTGTTARARELEERYHGLCENMEGAAAAQVAALHGVPWLEVRGISNIVEDRDLKKWDIPRATLAAQLAIQHIVEGWNR